MAPYENITYSLAKPIASYISSNLSNSSEASFYKKEILARGGYLLLAPLSIVTSLADTIIGVVLGVASIATAGKEKRIYNCTLDHLQSGRKIVVRPYVNFIKALNPEAKFSGSIENMDRMTRLFAEERKDAFITGDGDGFITDFVFDKLRSHAQKCYNSNNLVSRHIGARLSYGLLALSCLVTRAVDGLIGVPSAIISCLTFGKIESINNLAYRGLQFPGVIKDLFYCSVKIINPWAGTSPRN